MRITATYVLLLLGLASCVAAPYPEEPHPRYYGGVVYDYHPYNYGYYGPYPTRVDHHRYYNWGYWKDDGHRHERNQDHDENHAEHGRHH